MVAVLGFEIMMQGIKKQKRKDNWRKKIKYNSGSSVYRSETEMAQLQSPLPCRVLLEAKFPGEPNSLFQP